jgi:glycosyltransferase involved in cell wall biosynthesis
METLSVVIISQKNIGRCLDSVSRVADEIIVLDSYSTDDTVNIAKQKGALVKQQTFNGYKEQKNLAMRYSTHDYVLSLDADECLSEQLIQSIIEAKQQFKFKAYTMNRCNRYCGRFIRRGLWYPDKKLRLFDKNIAHWGGLNPHDKIELTENSGVYHLNGDILHYAYDSVQEYIQRNEQLSSIAAQSLYESGKKQYWIKIISSPFWAFFNGYVLRLGFLDGFYGYEIAIYTAQQTFLKYVKFFRIHKQQQPIENYN